MNWSWFYHRFFIYFVSATNLKTTWNFSEANLQQKISICVNKIATNFQAIFGSSCPFVGLCILSLWALSSYASKMCLEVCNILKFYCAHDHSEQPRYTQKVLYFVTEMFCIRISLSYPRGQALSEILKLMQFITKQKLQCIEKIKLAMQIAMHWRW